jgi:hypothetical protein
LWAGTEGNLVTVNTELSKSSWFIDIPSAKEEREEIEEYIDFANRSLSLISTTENLMK